MNPITIFEEWYSRASANTVVLATTSAELQPSARVVLLKRYDSRGLVFFTNLGSRKAQDIASNDKVAMLFFWPELHKQVRVEGKVALIPDNEADEYFASRDRASQIGAWASKQSEAMKDATELEDRVSQFTQKFAQMEEIARPPFWSGFRLSPFMWEFWEEGKARLHKRRAYLLNNEGWEEQSLFP